MEIIKNINDITGETLLTAKHPSGLDIYVIPKKNYKSTYAIFGTKYGSVDSEFVVPGENTVTTVPDGIAHYLEHKMFDQPDGSSVFDKFSEYGANANAFTSFNMTGYLFSCTNYVEENLAILLEYVQSPYFTPESVKKEQGIIGQEIRMYEDNGDWKLLFNFIGNMYHNHPIKKEIAGTIDSIAQITPEYLYKCYNTFYNLSNMKLVIIGNTDDKIFDVIDKNIKTKKPFNEEIKHIYKEEPPEIVRSFSSENLSVSMPMFMTGFKDTDVGYDGNALLKKYTEITILLKMIFGKSSELYDKLYREGLINQNFGYEFNMQPDYGFSVIEGESQDPQKVYDIILEEIGKYRREGFEKETFERIKKVVWGDYIRFTDDIQEFAGNFLQFKFMGIDYFDFYNVYKDVTFEDVLKRFNEHFVTEHSTLSVVNPSETK